MTTDHLKPVIALFEQLRKEYAANNLQKTGDLLTQLKVALTQLKFLQDDADTKELLLTRKFKLILGETLEIGAYWSIQTKDIASFERYFSQLKTFYSDYREKLAESQRMYPLIGLNLLRLLAQNRIAEFHTELELLDADVLLNNVYIKHPIQIEQCLMEGSYNKVWNCRKSVPAQEYLIFMDILVDTIRNEIGQCAEKAYQSIPLTDAVTLLYFENQQQLLQFCQKNHWKVDNGKIVFSGSTDNELDVPVMKILSNTLEYAKELERIV